MPTDAVGGGAARPLGGPGAGTLARSISTGTTIVTFLIVFLIQNTQNRDSIAMQVKLDELLRATAGAQNALLNLGELTEAQLERLRAHYERLVRAARDQLGQRLDPGVVGDPLARAAGLPAGRRLL